MTDRVLGVKRPSAGARRRRAARLSSVLLVVVVSAIVYADDTPTASAKAGGTAPAREAKPAAESAAPEPKTDETQPKPPAAPPATGPVADFITLVVRKWPDYVFGGVFGVAVGFLGKWLLDQLSARIGARREFAKEVTKQISSLAEKHYWALANAAGVLAGQLEGYLANRTAYLIIPWERRSALRAQLGELAAEAGGESFYHLCQMIWLFDSFQFHGSTTYLLTSHTAGDMCKRLYNMFVGSLSQVELANIRELSIDVVEGAGEKTVKVNKKLRDLPAGSLTKDVINQRLHVEKEAYIEWLKGNIVGVATAANALRAFNELLNQELTLLYRVWFQERAPFPEAYRYEQQFGQWPDLLTRQSADTLSLAGYQSDLLRPLGAAGAAQAGTDSGIPIQQPSAEQKEREGAGLKPQSAPKGGVPER